MTLPGLPSALPVPRRCRCCRRLVPSGVLYDGLGEKCARRAGLLPPKLRRVVRRRPTAEQGPGLLAFLPATALDDEPGDEPDPTEPQTCTHSDEGDS
ncbi:hypothetical protein [Verrucosispora sp. WMMC514]|uniref:hypothetical protein n=1 Tax=Verrucosispora sp. WMMC514 TaxID=3015156 RepID=UPI00248C5BDE|nr:hypothetical protein [Verrucosispora sp. WMMC514]WBB94215.1 hypothetical protein O7597_15300 [Verrucosispora sp. WMMC514]